MPATAGMSEMLETLIADGTSTAAGAEETAITNQQEFQERRQQ
jgi:hypothetical protein